MDVLRKRVEKYSSKVLAGVLTSFIIAIVILSGPASAFIVSLESFNDDSPIEGEHIYSIASIEIKSNERVNIPYVSLFINDELMCAFNAYTGTPSGDCAEAIHTISLINTSATDNSYGYGYGYGYGYAYGEEYGYGYGYTQGYSNTKFTYNITIDTLGLTPGQEYEMVLSTDLGPRNYSSEAASFSIGKNVSGDLFEDVGFLLPVNETDPENISNVTVNNEWIINVTVGSDSAEVEIPEGTVIKMGDNSSLNLTKITANIVGLSNLSGLTGFDFKGAVQFGIPNMGLTFSQPITIKMVVGDALNGQTLQVYRSTTGTSGWTQTGIEAPKSCVVSSGICEFNATQASYFSSVSVSPTESTTSGSRASSCSTEWECTSWSVCTNNVQTRTCSYPPKSCTPRDTKPVETQSCTSIKESSGASGLQEEETETPIESSKKFMDSLFSLKGIGIILFILIIIGLIVILKVTLMGSKKI